MRKKLLFWEVITTLVTLGAFLIVFSILNGWEKIGIERNNAVEIAIAVTTVIVGVITIVNINSNAAVAAFTGAVGAIAAVLIAVCAVAAVTSGATAAIALYVVIAVVAAIVGIFSIIVGASAVITAGNKELKKSFVIISLIIETLVIFGTISAITFLFPI